MTKFDVVGFGALNVDTLYKVESIARAEQESFIESCTETCGGSAANTIVALARLGCRTGFIGKLANDHEGKLQLDCFQTEGVNTEGIIEAKHGKSGHVMGFVDKKGARALYINPGVNDTIESREINYSYVAETSFLHYSSFVGEKPFRAQKKLLAALPKNVKISFDPGSIYAQKSFADIEPIIRSSYVFMPNSFELELLTGEADYCKGADLMIGCGIKIVAVKLGNKGCYVTDGEEKLKIEPFKVDAIDTTGAGDAFNAGFLYGLLNSKNLEECGKLGNFVASKCVTKMGARAGLPFAKDLATIFG